MVLVREGADEPGGGVRSAELTLPGFVHDLCSGVHPLVAVSPFFRSAPLADHGLELVEPPAPLAHPLDDGSAVLLERSPTATAAGLGEDGPAYERLLGRLLRDWDAVEAAALAPLVRVPRRPVALGRFGLSALRSADGLARGAFRGERARALLAGCAAHSMLPLERRPSAAFGLVLLALGHRVGWPFPRGGSGEITKALVAELARHGGRVETGAPVAWLAELGSPRRPCR